MENSTMIFGMTRLANHFNLVVCYGSRNDKVESEFLELIVASRIAKEVKHPFRNLLMRKNRPQLIIAMAFQIFQKLTGINAIIVYAPVLFNTLGFGGDAAFYSAVITGAINMVSTIVSIYSVNKAGCFLLLEASVQMFFAQVVIAIILGIKVKDHSDNLDKGFAILVVIMVCVHLCLPLLGLGDHWDGLSLVRLFQWRHAPRGSVTVCVNLVFTFVIGQAFLSMLCHFKYGIFLFFGGWVLIMSVFVLFLVPETKNIPIEEMT